ncbi:solute carrier family 2, facilitated glucose transporter member 8-like isoform X2 [Asterias rubens]|uniref:solute carrier family 2, facilitated glucose transporter member 8-like isoform X2 n=1 Tax=Asterias rubens TaxID=7604 RepID=UPI001455132F|nr:solute carrier family 2, facilitated glucose transporter member 8-like isoform X2 [Asterias rubens]
MHYTQMETLPQNSNGTLFLCCGVALLAALSMGFALGYSSPADVDLTKSGILNESEASWFSSLLNIGAVMGGPIAGYLLGKMGRKITLMMVSLPFVAGWVLLAACETVAPLYIGRILTGIGAGMASLITPVYIAEMSSPQLRGLLGASFQLIITAGILIVYALGIAFNHVWLAITGGCLAALLVVLMLPMPESPRFYLIRHQREKALEILRWLRGPSADIDAECREVEDALDNSNEKFSMKEFTNPSLFKPLLISIALMIFQQCSGINAVMFNAKDIMAAAVTGISADVATVILAAVQVGATFLSVVLMDVAGRRILLTVAGVSMAISSATFGLYFQLKQGNHNNGTNLTGDFIDGMLDGGSNEPNLSWLSLISLVVYIIGFSIGWGPIPWLLMSEIFPSKARGAASAIATATNWMFAFIVTVSFKSMENALTDQGVFWLYSGVCVLSIIFVLLFVPETKGKTLEEIEAEFQSGSRHVRLETDPNDYNPDRGS